MDGDVTMIVDVIKSKRLLHSPTDNVTAHCGVASSPS